MPAGSLVTVPSAGVPALSTVSKWVGGGSRAKVAVTVWAALRVTTQGPVPGQAMPEPDQPVNSDAPSGSAVRVTSPAVKA